MAFDPSDDELQELYRDGWSTFSFMGGADLQKKTHEGDFWLEVPSGARNRKYNVEYKRNGIKELLGSATTLNGALSLVKKKLRNIANPSSKKVVKNIASNPKTKRLVGRILVFTDLLQEMLDSEVLTGSIITYKGETYHVGSFIGDKVELWRE